MAIQKAGIREKYAAASPGGAPIVAVQDLSKIFKDFWMRDRARAVDGVTFEIERGEVFGLLGPNGSGKSTTIKIILGLLHKTSGRVAVFGRLPSDVSIKKRIGYLPEESYLYPFLNARETLDYYAKLFQLDHRARKRRIDELLDMVGLSGVQHRQIREYSKGMQRRIGLAQALINDPEFLILDEPTTGLDPIGTRQVKDLIIQLGKRGKTILLSSHLLADVEECVTRMVILYGGKIRAEGTCDDLLESRSRSIIETDALDDATLADLRATLAKHRHTMERVAHPRQRLEDLFIDIVERAQADRLATSGATHAGATAGFLMGGERRDEGEALIEELVSRRPEPTPEAPKKPEVPKPAQRAEQIIDDLIAESGGGATKSAEQSKPSGKGPLPPGGDVDSDVIDSLLNPKKPDSGG
ncbi:MAG: ABC transporter ATP-binding protein [Phycisphaerales bacterium]|nr:ABC transporter ATP-binding protein [Phycisphaerales bacterium]